jgi:hypothetical protein
MHDLVKRHLPEIEALCRKHHVRRLDLFGSAAGETFDPARSDVDFVVEFGPEAISAWAEEYQALKADLELLLKHSVDLIEAPAIRNSPLKHVVEATQVPVYANPRP